MKIWWPTMSVLFTKGYTMFARSRFIVLVVTCCTSMQSMGTNATEVSVSTQVNETLWKHQMWCTWTRLFLSSSVTWQLSSRIVAKVFYVGELESELRRIGKIDYRFHLDSDLKQCMEMVESVRRESLYPHPTHMCTEECKKRGSGQLWVTDGIWKTVFPHCMFRVEHCIADIPYLGLPDVCVERHFVRTTASYFENKPLMYQQT